MELRRQKVLTHCLACCRIAESSSEEGADRSESIGQQNSYVFRSNLSNPPRPAAGVRVVKVGRNEPCPCGSGKKYKKCCLPKDEENARLAAAPSRHDSNAVDLGLQSWPDAPVAKVSDEHRDNSSSDDATLSETHLKLERLWKDFATIKRPTAAQMDEYLTQLLALAPELEEWGEIIHRFADLNHPDLPGVFRRISGTVPHTGNQGLPFFYWAAAAEFTNQGAAHLLPEVAAGFCKLGPDSYDADSLTNIEEHLLAFGFDTETLRLAEHFLPIMREDEDLMPFAVSNLCGLIFELRVGQAIRNATTDPTSTDRLARQLRSNIEDETDKDYARICAAIANGEWADAPWDRSAFDLTPEEDTEDEIACQNSMRLLGSLVRVSREQWLLDASPPGCSVRGLSLLVEFIYAWKTRQKKASSNNLLDFLRPAGLESRIVQSCHGLVGLNEPRALLLIRAHEILGRFAERHQLITPADLAPVEKLLGRLRRDIEKPKR